MPTYLLERFETTTIRVRHYGYLNERIAAKDKSRRNLELLEQEAREAPSPFNDYNLGSEYLALAEPGKAREYFDRSWDALCGQPGFASAGYVPLLASRRARARREVGDHAAALAAVEDGLRVYPDHTDLVMESALVARAQGRVADAESLLQRCLEMGDAPSRYAATAGTGTFLALTLLAEIAFERRDDAAAEELLRRSLREHPHYVAPALTLVEVLARRGAAGDEIAAVVPERPSAQVLAATALHEAGRSEDAEALFRRVLDARPQNPVARLGLAEALLAQSRFAEAAAAAAAEPSDSPVAAAAAAVRLFAAAAEGDAGTMDAILGESEHLLEPEDAQLHRAWAAALRGDESLPWVGAAAAKTAGTQLEALLRVRRIEAFVALLRVFETLAIEPRERREFLARVYLRRGYLESAADEWIAVMREAPDCRALIGLSQVAVARGFLDDALGFVSEALALEPGNTEAALMLEAIKLKNVKAA
jgi:tetratricopeptide (TPR) repeat protein